MFSRSFKYLFAGGALPALIASNTALALSFDLPSQVEPYTPFTIEIQVSALFPPNDYVFVDVQDDLIVIGHENRGPMFVSPSYPLEVQVQGLAPGIYRVGVTEMSTVLGPALGIAESQETITVSEAPPMAEVFAFFNDSVDRYFVTASVEEALQIEGLGWDIVDYGFSAWPAEGPAPEAAMPVCRFYSFEVNSHFYTANSDECSFLKEINSSWQFEGIAFQALVPIDGACPGGTDPVWRLYNGRFAELDSNHRFVASSETYRTMIASGWIGEGVAFCSPKADRVVSAKMPL